MKDPSEKFHPKDHSSQDNNSTTELGAISDRVATPFQSLIENAFDVIKILDGEGTIVYASPSAENITGFKREELVGRNAFEFVHPDDTQQAHEVFQKLLSADGETMRIEIRAAHKDGSWRTADMMVKNLLSHPVIRGIVVNYRDITDRKQAEEALRRSEERYHKAFSATPDAITLGYVGNGVFLEVNDGFERMTGYARDEVIGRSAIDLRLWKSDARRRELVESLRKSGRIRGFEAEFVTKTGAVLTCVVAAEIIELAGTPCMVAVTRDITEGKHAEEKLRLASEQLQSDHKALTEKNIALKQILDHLEHAKNAYRHRVAANVKDLIGPIIETLRKSGGQLKPGEIDLLEINLQRIVESDVDAHESNLSKLTARELDICELIKDGHSSKEIAETLGLSTQTVHKHRQTIRRKLQLNNKDINLAAYLRSR